jgi:hypothetical protein
MVNFLNLKTAWRIRMTVKEIEERDKAVVGIVADNHSASTVEGAVFDTKDFDSLFVMVNSGANGSSGTVDIKVEQGDATDLSDATDVTGAAFTQITESNDNDIYVGRVKCKNYKRYMRINAVVAVAACDFGVVCTLSKYDGLAPVTQVNTVEFTV